MNIKKLMLNSGGYPDILSKIPGPPKQLYYIGDGFEELMKRPRLAIVGSRSISPYGVKTTIKLAKDLAEQGVVIVSGLALGVDCIAHKAALEAGGQAIAVLPGPLDKIVPATNWHLSQKIIEEGGVLVSEYNPGDITFKQNFVARNRIVSGLADAVLITEAGKKSGSLHTASFALSQGKTVLAVPGDIDSPVSIGTNNLLKTGATPVTSYLDVMYALGFERHNTPVREVKGRNAYEQTVLDLLLRGITDGSELLESSKLTVSEFAQVLTMLEIDGKIRSLGANHWALF